MFESCRAHHPNSIFYQLFSFPPHSSFPEFLFNSVQNHFEV
jgi:hypothetical protein